MIRPTPTLFVHFYYFKRVCEWYYLTARPTTPKIFGSLAESVRVLKEKFLVVSSPDGYDFPTTYSELIRMAPMVLLEYDVLAWLELHTFMDKRKWKPLNAQEIVKHWCSEQSVFNDEGMASTPGPVLSMFLSSSCETFFEEAENA